MCQQSRNFVEAENLKNNVFKTVFYLFEAVREEDFETVDLELEDLITAVSRLKDFHASQERKQKLVELVQIMKERGVKIDFAKRAFFLNNGEKNAVENSRYEGKKKQQA